ncbi:MAG TPA: hypothetical protein PLG10_02445, partial [Candidatus Dojkabacteria bacterium]|nr:hypothetical protein [Candidatus Dojkabacteria bacterium]
RALQPRAKSPRIVAKNIIYYLKYIKLMIEGMKTRNIKNLFVTTLISLVSFLLNVLPVRAEGGLSSDSLQDMPLGGVATPTPGEILSNILRAFLSLVVLPIAVIMVIFFIVKSLKQKKEAKKPIKPKSKSKKTKKE